MKNLNEPPVAEFRVVNDWVIKNFGSPGDSGNGFFIVRSNEDNLPLRVVAASDFGWDHVSVSREDRCPLWSEMCYIKDLFFRENDIVIQYHPPKNQYVNIHPHCLHLWRRRGLRQNMPMPPIWMV